MTTMTINPNPNPNPNTTMTTPTIAPPRITRPRITRPRITNACDPLALARLFAQALRTPPPDDLARRVAEALDPALQVLGLTADTGPSDEIIEEIDTLKAEINDLKGEIQEFSRLLAREERRASLLDDKVECLEGDLAVAREECGEWRAKYEALSFSRA